MATIIKPIGLAISAVLKAMIIGIAINRAAAISPKPFFQLSPLATMSFILRTRSDTPPITEAIAPLREPKARVIPAMIRAIPAKVVSRFFQSTPFTQASE